MESWFLATLCCMRFMMKILGIMIDDEGNEWKDVLHWTHVISGLRVFFVEHAE